MTDRHLWKIETGDGLEGILPDVICKRIGAETLVTQFKAGKYGTERTNVFIGAQIQESSELKCHYSGQNLFFKLVGLRFKQ